MRFLKVWVNDDKNNNNKQIFEIWVSNNNYRVLKVWINDDNNNSNKQMLKIVN